MCALTLYCYTVTKICAYISGLSLVKIYLLLHHVDSTVHCNLLLTIDVMYIFIVHLRVFLKKGCNKVVTGFKKAVTILYFIHGVVNNDVFIY